MRCWRRVEEITQPKRKAALIAERDLALVSRQLVQLKTDCPLPMPLSDLRQQAFDRDIFQKFLQEQGFKSLIRKLGGASDQGDDDNAVPAVRDRTINAKIDAPSFSASPNGLHPTSGNAHDYPLPDRTNYELITTAENLQIWITSAIEQGYLAFDTETTGLDTMQAELVGISLALSPGRAAYIPLAHATEPPRKSDELALSQSELLPGQIPLKTALALLQPLLSDDSVLKIGHKY